MPSPSKGEAFQNETNSRTRRSRARPEQDRPELILERGERFEQPGGIGRARRQRTIGIGVGTCVCYELFQHDRLPARSSCIAREAAHINQQSGVCDKSLIRARLSVAFWSHIKLIAQLKSQPRLLQTREGVKAVEESHARSARDEKRASHHCSNASVP
jgi:hypothetical protein